MEWIIRVVSGPRNRPVEIRVESWGVTIESRKCSVVKIKKGVVGEKTATRQFGEPCGSWIVTTQSACGYEEACGSRMEKARLLASMK